MKLPETLRRRLNQWVLLGQPMLVRLAPGDVLVVTVQRPLTEERRWQLRSDLEQALGHRHEILILEGGDLLGVVRNPEFHQ